MTVYAKFVGIYGFNGTKHLIIPYHNPSNLQMLFYVVPRQREAYMVTTSPSSYIIFFSVHYEVNQNLMKAQK